MLQPLALFILAITLSSCSLKPTKVYDKRSLDFRTLQQGALEPIVITDDTVVIDSRSPFEFTMARIPGSVNLHWDEFAQEKFPGKIKPDFSRIARRLALLGIQPETPVVIVGNGRDGSGEEGRLAWMLLYLGVKNVQVAKLNALDVPMTNVKNNPPRKNAPSWEPQVTSAIEANRAEVLDVIGHKSAAKTFVIDVRTEKEYFRKSGFGGNYVTPNIQAININWKEFYNYKGRPNFEILNQLQGIGISKNHRILVISDNGQRSATATTALLTMGFHKAANVSGGYNEILNKPANRFK